MLVVVFWQEPQPFGLVLYEWHWYVSSDYHWGEGLCITWSESKWMNEGELTPKVCEAQGL